MAIALFGTPGDRYQGAFTEEAAGRQNSVADNAGFKACQQVKRVAEDSRMHAACDAHPVNNIIRCLRAGNFPVTRRRENSPLPAGGRN